MRKLLSKLIGIATLLALVWLGYRYLQRSADLEKLAREGRIEDFRTALRYIPDVNASLRSGWTPLTLACELGDMPSVYALLQRGADPNVRNDADDLPLEIACRNVEDLRCAKLLLKSGALVHGPKRFKGVLPLFSAVFTRNEDAVRLLLAAGANPDLLSVYDTTSREWAQQKGYTEILELFKGIGDGKKIYREVYNRPRPPDWRIEGGRFSFTVSARTTNSPEAEPHTEYRSFLHSAKVDGDSVTRGRPILFATSCAAVGKMSFSIFLSDDGEVAGLIENSNPDYTLAIVSADTEEAYPSRSFETGEIVEDAAVGNRLLERLNRGRNSLLKLGSNASNSERLNQIK